MGTFAHRQSQPHTPTTASIARPKAAAPGVRSAAPSPADLQRLHPFDFARIPLTAPPIQRKLAVNSPGDRFEREADAMADRVMGMAPLAATGPALNPAISQAPAIQRACAACEEEKKKATPHQSTPTLQAVEDGEDEYPPVTQTVILRKAVGSAAPVAGEPAQEISGRLAQREAGGEPLPAAARQRMEQAFGYDFSRVRIHRDAEAGLLSRQLSAQAFTHGRHIFFGNGKYDPAGAPGNRLLAHELTHVVQQGQAAPHRRPATQPATAGGAPPAAVQRTASLIVQRTATWTARPAHEVNNLATSILTGSPVGVTWPMLNGSTFWSRADARRLTARPTLSFSSAPSGGVNATVATVPTNTGSFDETVLAAGPWNTTVPKSTVGARYTTLTKCTGADNTNFRAIGKPTDAAMFAANRRHEDRHARDHQASFVASFIPWDIKLTVAMALGTTFTGATQADAEAALYAAMGGTPDQIADAYMDACAAAVGVYHGTPAGGNVTEANPTANADCTTSSVESTNPS